MNLATINLMVLGLLSSGAVWASCDAQLKAFQAELEGKKVTLQVKRKVNDVLHPLTVPRKDLNPYTVAECQKKIQDARALLTATEVAVTAK
ncbi:hypothetical protein NT239_00720 [Chitinibacter sp. SCUT-21]|uniref:hypothetical protein n=1 Tax=Chitinibacter sp. SCUT-21 TaxID=2970891 RepID=UPI0035A710AD